MKKLFSFILCFAILLSLVSCGSTEEISSEASKAVSDESNTSSDSLTTKKAFVICAEGYGDSKLLLIRAMSSKLLKSCNSVDVDSFTPAEGYDIPEADFYLVVGEATDEAKKIASGLNEMDYVIKTADNYTYIVGGCTESTNAAIERFTDNQEDYEYKHTYILSDASVNGVALKDFRIVYAETKNEAQYSDVASSLVAMIKKDGAFTLNSVASTEAESANEILLGITGREVTSGMKESRFNYNEYKIIISGTKVAIIGNNAVAVYHGAVKLCEMLSESKSLTDTEVSGECELIKVACIGDSITAGANSTNPVIQNYPSYLQLMLGYNYLVKNFGADGYSVVASDEYSYIKHTLYYSCKKFAPDIALWLLGTNDGNPGQAYKSWENTNREEKYKESANTHFDMLEKANPDVKIFIGLPSTLFKSTVWTQWEEWGNRIVKYVIPLNRKLAEERGYEIIDIYSWALENSSVFTDGLHPKDESYKDFAKRVYDEIIDKIETKTTEDIQ